MSIERQRLHNHIIDKLTYLKSKVQVSNSLNLTDVNIISENFYGDFLNLVFSYNLVNANKGAANIAAIDLRDEKNRIAIQVTSTSSLTKSRKTVKGFIDNGLYKKFDRLIILNIVSKADHRISKLGDAQKFELDTKDDIWDVSSLLEYIFTLSPEKLQELCSFLDKEIKQGNDITYGKEIATFASLIGFLSDENHQDAGNGFIDQPDPHGKIYKRFANHATFLLTEYQDLFSEYGAVLEDVIKQASIGHVRVRRLEHYLKRESDETLTKANDDPKLALKMLTEDFKQVLSRNKIEYDENAIRFFLVDQLIRCNVFPNKAANNV